MMVDMGLSLDTFMVENVSLPEELQKMLDARMGMNMIGDMGKYTQFQVAQSLPVAAANEGGGVAGMGVGLGAGLAMGQTFGQAVTNAMRPPEPGAPQPPQPVGGAPVAPATPGAATKFCVNCGKPIPKTAKFCPECGGAQ
jgi:membrane protease subunit (stomatin/prohibitin family)